MLVIPGTTRATDELCVLVTEDPAAAGVPACTPEAASRLLVRWAGARLERRDGWEWVVLPLRPVERGAA